MDVATLRELYGFNSWANSRILAAVAGVPPADFLRDLRTSHRSIRDTLVHVLSAEWIWLERWKGSSPPAMLAPEDFPEVDAIRTRWGAVERDRDAFMASLSEDRLKEPLSYVNLKGERFTYPLWQQMFHVVNHGSYHRGQITTLLRQVAREPLATDYLVYRDEG